MSYLETLMSRIRRTMPWSGIKAAAEHLVTEGAATPEQAREAAAKVRADLNRGRR